MKFGVPAHSVPSAHPPMHILLQRPAKADSGIAAKVLRNEVSVRMSRKVRMK